MRVAWITRSFLDYRIPVFRELDQLLDQQLTLTFNGEYVPETVRDKAVGALGDRAYPLSGERKLGGEDQHHLANRNFSLRYQPGLRRHIQTLRPDVMVCDGFFKWTLPAMVHRIRSGTPLVILYERTAHTERRAQWIRTSFRKAVVKVTDAMGCSGRLCQEYTETLGMDPGRITLGHMSADTDGLRTAVRAIQPSEREATRARLGLRGTVFLYVGRMDPRKGCRELLRAWAQAAIPPQEGTLLMVGDGPERSELEEMPEASGVVFAGRIPYDELPAIYAAADAFVIATLEDNWSLVVPEAMACELPILSSIYNGCWPELVRDGQNGWAFDPLRTEDCARALKNAVDASPRLASMGHRSGEIIADFGARQAAESIKRACEIAIAYRG